EPAVPIAELAAGCAARHPPYERGGWQAMIYAPARLDEGTAARSGERVFRAILDRAGLPRFRRRANGFPTLLHIILEQQVSIDAAAAMHRRLARPCPAPERRPVLAR